MFSRLGALIDLLIIGVFIILIIFAFLKFGSNDNDIQEDEKEKRRIVRVVESAGNGLLFVADLFKKTDKIIEENSELIENVKSNAQSAINEIDGLTKSGMTELGYQEFQYQDLKNKSFWQKAWTKTKEANFRDLWRSYWQKIKN